MPTAGVIMDASAALLNDSAKTIYTYVVQLPYLKNALLKLEGHLEMNGLPKIRKRATPATIAAGTLVYTNPSDIIIPISLWEKAVGETDDYYVPIEERMSLPNVAKDTFLRVYTWQADTIQFVGATTSRVVLLEYYATLPLIVDDTTNVAIIRSQSYLAAKTAELCAKFIGGSVKRSEMLEKEAEEELAMFLAPIIKARQSMPVRRIPFGGFWR